VQTRFHSKLTSARAPRAGRAARGFTFVEVLAVVAIVAIASALAVPMFKDSNISKLRAAASMVVADLEYAQTDSITHGDALRMFVVGSTTNYSIATVATPTTPITNPVGKAPYSVTFGQGRAASLSGVTISAYSLNGDARLGFGLYGQLDQSSNATITLTCGGRNVVITLNATTGTPTIGTIN